MTHGPAHSTSREAWEWASRPSSHLLERDPEKRGSLIPAHLLVHPGRREVTEALMKRVTHSCPPPSL